MSDLFDLMGTARAVRWLRPDPVPAEVVERLVWAATRAPSPGNTQDWAFVCVDDREVLGRIGAAVASVMGPAIDRMDKPDRATRVMLTGARHLATNLAAAPLVVFVCGGVAYPPGRPRVEMTWSALYPATQNLLLAARALGLGATLTTLHAVAEPVVRAELGLPDDVVIAATVPVGYPAVPFGAVTRRPVAEVLHRNRWGATGAPGGAGGGADGRAGGGAGRGAGAGPGGA